MKARGLSEEFIKDLKQGILTPLLQSVQKDCDLLLEIRRDEIHIYFKGNRLLLLSGKCAPYKIGNCSFQVPQLAGLCQLSTVGDTDQFIKAIPQIKEKITCGHQGLNEIECEQLLIRFNNHETLNTEYTIIDRQCARQGEPEDRPDLIGVYWPRANRNRNRKVSLALMEIKKADNPDIEDLDQQISRYYELVARNLDSVIDEAQHLLAQKLDLDLIVGTPERLKALRELEIVRDINEIRFDIVLVDYNKAGSKFAKAKTKLMQLPFAKQIGLFHLGFGLWESNRSLI